MAFLESLSERQLRHYHETMVQSTRLRSHFDLLAWLQGDLQFYLPHEILVATWGDFRAGEVQHDILSPIAGVRSTADDATALTPLLLDLFERWKQFKRRPYSLNAGSNGFLPRAASADDGELPRALRKMRTAMVHGVLDERGRSNCLYVAFRSAPHFEEIQRRAMGTVLPYIDTALRQIALLPDQGGNSESGALHGHWHVTAREADLSDREAEILNWVAKGKTNVEIALILNISAFTVKNHMQRVFRKLDVTNRAQAVSKFSPLN